MEILGQAHVLHYLTEGLKRDRLSPSLLFVGPEGVGKRSCAFELAKCFACTEIPTNASLPRCGKCRACLQIQNNNHADLLYVNRAQQAALLREKPESQTAIKIESVRQADKFANFRPLEAKRRVIVIDEAHRLNNESANALLKLLEEPPNNAQLILLALNEHALPSTILSRCAILRFRPVAVKTLSDWLEKNYAVAEEMAMKIADGAGGSFEKALTLKDEDRPTADLSDYTMEEFFDMVSEASWRKEGKKNAEKAIFHLIELSQKKMEQGDFQQSDRLRALLSARKQLDRHVPPKLVLEALFLKLEGSK